MMTQKDFKLIAEVIREQVDDPRQAWRLANVFADRLKQQNARFDKGKFFHACGVPVDRNDLEVED
jgi:hypothetical protein